MEMELNLFDYVPAPPEKIVVVSQNVTFKKKKEKQTLVTSEECKICSVKFTSSTAYEEHLKSDLHFLTHNYLTNKNSFIENGDIIVEIEEGAGNQVEEKIISPNKNYLIPLTIKNKSDKIYNILEYIDLNKKSSEMSLNRNSLPSILHPQSCDEALFNVNFETSKSDVYVLVLVISEHESQKKFFVHKSVIIFAMADFMLDLYPTTPYMKPIKSVVMEVNEEVVPGEPMPKGTFSAKIPLQLFKLPVIISVLLNCGLKLPKNSPGNYVEKLNEIKKLLNVSDFKNCLNAKFYYEMLKFLLYAEEHQMLKDIRDFDMLTTDLKATSTPTFFKLNVPGLAEHRPSIIVGDTVGVKEIGAKIKYQGVVHAIEETTIVLGFHRSFANHVYQPGLQLEVSFSFNRYSLRAEHQAIQIIYNHKAEKLLFPTKQGNNKLTTTSFEWRNKNIKNNEEQQQAIAHIFSKTAYPAPYLIFGPPGTGKTSTLVEAIYQIWHINKDEKMLVCAPSNHAANEISKRLLGVIPTTDLLRYMAGSFPHRDIPKELLPYVNYNKFGQHYHPTFENLKKFKIVITTTVNSSRLTNLGVPSGHFSYVFIDECGNCTETESLIPISILTSKQHISKFAGQVVLAGDPKQLGPIIHSPLAKQYGLDVSMLERFMNTLNLYQKDGNGKYNRNVLTKLVKNYRSHPAIIEVPNKLFYDNELESKGDHLINCARNIDILKNKNIPILFHNVIGKDQREASSPSWFNLAEVETVVRYIDELLSTRLQGMKVVQEHIGVITPYRQQVKKFNTIFSRRKWNNITVGSVEQFQGQERLIIIISTVRSSPEFLHNDNKYRLGFLKNSKRFNVAITRSKALLIVVGNGNLLQNDSCWYEFMEYCVTNKLITGTPFKLAVKPEPIEDLIINMENLKIDQGFEKVVNNMKFNEGPLDDSTDFSRGNA